MLEVFGGDDGVIFEEAGVDGVEGSTEHHGQGAVGGGQVDGVASRRRRGPMPDGHLAEARAPGSPSSMGWVYSLMKWRAGLAWPGRARGAGTAEDRSK